MKKNILLILTIAALALCGCGEVKDKTNSGAANNDSSSASDSSSSAAESTPDDTEDSSADDSSQGRKGRPMTAEDWHVLQGNNSPDTIVLISRYSNCAWGYQDNGKFITLDGRVYNFDFGDNIGSYKKDPSTDFIGALEDIRDSEGPASNVDADVVAQCLSYAMQVDPEAEFTRESVACDAGQHSVYCVRNGEMIQLSTYGDNSGELCDDYADAILDLLDESGIMSTGRNSEFAKAAHGSFAEGIKDIIDHIL